MAIPAIDPVVSNVVLVAERNRLGGRHGYIGDERTGVNPICGPYDSAQHDNRRHNADLRQAVGTSVKNLRHRQTDSDTGRFARRACFTEPTIHPSHYSCAHQDGVKKSQNRVKIASRL